MATMNHTIKLGIVLYHATRFSPSFTGVRNKKGVTTASTTIHKARVSFTVVATSRADTPCACSQSGCMLSYAQPAPTTDEVSWMAIAAHIPNCFMLIVSAVPIYGNTNKATAFSMNTTPNDTDICSGLAFIIGPTAAIAEPPQMAVPEEIK